MKAPSKWTHLIQSASGLRAEINAHGGIRSLRKGDVTISLFGGNAVEGGPANVWLRRLGKETTCHPLLGPASGSEVTFFDQGFRAAGSWQGIDYSLEFLLCEDQPIWLWQVALENQNAGACEVDVIMMQDVALAHEGAIRLNTYYVSQYIDHTALSHAEIGCVIASRQNQAVSGRFPSCLIGSTGHACAYATDALQIHGYHTRSSQLPPALRDGLPNCRLQHEHSMVAIQESPRVLDASGSTTIGFFGFFLDDHPNASAPSNLVWVDSALEAARTCTLRGNPQSMAAWNHASIFCPAAPLISEEISIKLLESWLGESTKHHEKSGEALQSCFTASGRHVVMMAKERTVLRPHGMILHSGKSSIPDESALTSTTWMCGVFHSMITQGHVSINRFLSTTQGYLGFFKSHGLRVFVEIDNQWKLLEMPSAFHMSERECGWLYAHHSGLLEVRSSAGENAHELSLQIKVLEGGPSRFLLSFHTSLGSHDGCESIPASVEIKGGHEVHVRPCNESDVGRRFPNSSFSITCKQANAIDQLSDDALLYPDGISRLDPFVCQITHPMMSASWIIQGHLIDESSAAPSNFPDRSSLRIRVQTGDDHDKKQGPHHLAEILPWWMHNAWTHFLSPRGLEQYSGGGWGTRDVCQGPIELLSCISSFLPMRDLILRVFSQQNPDGDWPQWFMFFDRERNIRPDDSHGDIVFWPLLALSQYLLATGDEELLEEKIPFFHADSSQAEIATITEHIARACHVIEKRVIDGTHLAAYGHGDWNDSLQPVQPEMRTHLCSSWTVTLHYQTWKSLANAYAAFYQLEKAQHFHQQADAIYQNFQQHLIIDEVITGMAYFLPGVATSYAFHPRDQTTGIHYSLLPMIHAILNDLLTPNQAQAHLALIRQHLLGPDGARLFDRPFPYSGGVQKQFQRAESASYFGREIGLMYSHAHLRYAEALAHVGDAQGFFHALCQLCPICLDRHVPNAAPRQSNVYFSSSDAAFADRDEASEHYQKIHDQVPLEGGWRVYSSGAGIASRLIVQCFFGIKLDLQTCTIDPVISTLLDPLSCHLDLDGHSYKIIYRISKNGCGPKKISLNGTPLPFSRDDNPHRLGAAIIQRSDWISALIAEINLLEIDLH
ncbi:MAG: hypothetical protein EAZ42_09610 [Verrucomicrobia bacterium]|nr:MAG: hypothetical protein EAZ42_09610 [Verrucomicrobiota bacterium]